MAGITTKTNISEMFKTVYGDYTSTLYGAGSEDVLESIIKKDYKVGGTELKMAEGVSFGGSTGTGVLPKANQAKTVNPTITTKASYGRLRLDRKAMKESKKGEQAFKDVTKYQTEMVLKSYTRTQACFTYNDGTSIFGQYSGNSAGTATAPIVTILTTGLYGFRPAHFEEGDLVNVRQSGTTLLPSVFEIVAVDTATRAITLSRISGTDNLTTLGAGTHDVVLDGSLNTAPTGLLSLFNFSSGNLYGVPFQRRFSPYKLALSNTPAIGVEYLNKAILQMDQRSGEVPDFILTSTTQMERLLNAGESQKRFSSTKVQGESVKLSKGQNYRMSFSGVTYDSPNGAIDVVSSRYVRDDMIILGSKEKLKRHHADDFGWFDDDGTVLLREADSDSYEARYGGYYENYFQPFYFGFVTGFAS